MEFFSPVSFYLYKTWLLVILRLGMGLTVCFCWDSSALEPTSDCQRLDILQPQGFIYVRLAQQLARAGGLWFTEAD